MAANDSGSKNSSADSGNQNFRPATPYSSAGPINQPVTAQTSAASSIPSSQQSNAAVSPAAASTGAAAGVAAANWKESKSAAPEETIEVEYSLEELQGMSLKELQGIAKEAGIDTKGLSKEELLDAITEELGITEQGEEAFLSDEEGVEGEEIDGEMSMEEAMALLGEDSSTEDDFSDVEFEEVEEEVVEGEVDDFTSNN